MIYPEQLYFNISWRNPATGAKLKRSATGAVAIIEMPDLDTDSAPVASLSFDNKPQTGWSQPVIMKNKVFLALPGTSPTYHVEVSPLTLTQWYLQGGKLEDFVGVIAVGNQGYELVQWSKDLVAAKQPDMSDIGRLAIPVNATNQLTYINNIIDTNNIVGHLSQEGENQCHLVVELLNVPSMTPSYVPLQKFSLLFSLHPSARWSESTPFTDWHTKYISRSILAFSSRNPRTDTGVIWTSVEEEELQQQCQRLLQPIITPEPFSILMATPECVFQFIDELPYTSGAPLFGGSFIEGLTSNSKQPLQFKQRWDCYSQEARVIVNFEVKFQRTGQLILKIRPEAFSFLPASKPHVVNANVYESNSILALKRLKPLNWSGTEWQELVNQCRQWLLTHVEFITFGLNVYYTQNSQPTDPSIPQLYCER